MRRRFQLVSILLLILGLTLVVPRSKAQNVERLPGQSATLLPDGRLLLIGGEGLHGPMSTAETLDPQSGAITPLRTGLNRPRAWHTATMLPSGQILVFGGIGSDAHGEGLSEVFDPTEQQFAVIPSLGIQTRAYHTATLLTDGRVLIAGGLSRSRNTIETMVLWDYRTNSATTLPQVLLVPRSKHAATLLADGSVLLHGGVDESGNALDFDEVFDPLSQRARLEPSALSRQEGDLSPQLEASLPPDQSTDVPTNAFVSLRFSKPLNVVTVNSRTVSLSDPQGAVRVNIVPAEGGRLAFISPGETLLSGTTYTLLLSGLSDGNTTLDDISLSFTTLGAVPPGNNGEITGTAPEPDDIGSQALNSPYRNLSSLEAPTGVTAVSGQVLKLNGRPLENVTLSIGGLSAATDITGRFLLAPLSAGHHVMLIEGRTANTNRATYGLFEVRIDVTTGKTNILPFTIWMPAIDMAHAVTLHSPTLGEVIITTPLIPGLELHLPPNTIIRDHDGRVVTQISLTPVPVDRPPFPLAKGVNVPLYFTIQPGSAYVHVLSSTGQKGAWVVYPNVKHAPPGTRFGFWNYDPEEKGWYLYGKGTAERNGKKIVPDPGVVVYEFTGAMVALLSAAPPNGPVQGNPNNNDGDPVDLGTGLFVQSKTDLFLPDIIPINLTRTYRPGDSLSRAFGIGTTQFYDIFLIGDNNPFTFAELILPDGGRIHYDRISAGTGFIDALYQHTSSPTIFYGSTITFNEAEFAWDLRLKDGMVLVFGAATAATIPGQVALLEIRDRCGNVLRLTRDASFNLTTINSPNGRWIQLNYDSSNRVTQAKDNADRTVNYTYDSLGRLSTIKDGNGGLTTYTYDTSNQMLSIKDARGIVYLANQYDANGRVVKQTFADGATYQFKYTLDTQGNIIETDVTEPRGIVRTVKFQSNGYLISDTRAVGKPEQEIVTYNRQSNTNLVLGVIDPLGNATAYTYDAMANVTSITRLARTSNAVTTSFTYDPQFNQVTSAIDALKHKTSFGYDDTGNVTTVTDPLGHQWTLAYNGAGQPVSLTDPLKNSTQLSYLAGDLVVITDPLGHVLTRTVDGAGRLVALTDAVANTTRYSYDSLSQLIQVVDPLQGVTKFSYNQNGDVLSITDARNNITHYVYDNMDRLVSRTDPLLRKESYSYDLSGNLTQFTDRRGNTIQLGYDGLNRAMSVAFGNGGGTLSYSYDKGNRITKVLDSLFGSIARTYDGLNRLTSENTPQGTVTYTYDAVGKRTSMAVTSQTGVNYSYDQANRLIKIAQGSATVSFTYDAGNRQMALTLPNGVLAAYAYDQASRLTGLTYTRGSATIGSLTYTYDEAGRRTNVGGDLSSTDLPQTIGFATYDVANQLTRLDTAKFTYDADGNLTGDGVNTFTWNTRNQLTQVSASGVPFASFRYDGFGRRQAKTTSGLTTQFLYDHLNVVQEITSTKTNLLTGLRTDQIFTRTDASGVRSFLTDALGSSLALTDANGDIQTQYAYASFGNTVVSGSPSANSFQYTGRENDGTGLYYYRARYYAPGYNRFISEDPLRFVAGDANFYAYTRNSPTNFNDPSGKTGMIVAGNRVQSLSGRKTILSSGLFPVDLFRPLSWGDAMKIFALVSGLKGLYGQDPLHFIKKLPSPEYDPKATLEFPDPISPPPSLDATLEVLEEEGLSLQEVAELEALELEAAEAAELTEILETVAVLALL